MKALLRVDDKKELSNPPRVQEKELKEPEKISLWTPKDLELKETELVSVFFRLEFSLRILSLHLQHSHSDGNDQWGRILGPRPLVGLAREPGPVSHPMGDCNRLCVQIFDIVI